MTRALSSSWRFVAPLLGALFLIALTSSAALANKPTVAILGLEVVDPSGIDATSTSVARDLTDQLRLRAKAGTGPYQLAIGSEKELIDEKLIHNCDAEAVACMAEIGKNLGANYLIYGRLEKKPTGYAVTINLLNVDKRMMEKAKSPLTIGQKDSTAIAAAARKAYNDLTGTTELGTLVITANAQRGTVLLDDEPKGNLNSGSLTLTNLEEGRYRLAIEADGYKRSDEVVVTIRSGETATQPITLVEGKSNELTHEISGTTSQAKTNIWKPVFYVSLVAGAGLAAWSGITYFQMGKLESPASDPPPGFEPGGGRESFGPQDCSRDVEDYLSEICGKYKQHKYTGYAAIGVGVIVVASGILTFTHKSTERAPAPGTTARRVRKKPQFSVTPVVSVDGGGATFQIDW